MKYYKIISETNFVGVGTSNELRRWQRKHNIILSCNEDKAQYIQCGDELYHDNWMVPETIENSKYATVKVIEISEKEYNTLHSAVESGEEIPPQEDDVEIIEDIYIDPETQLTIEFVVNSKITEMSNVCNQLICKGFDVILSDKKVHHFSLTTQDQLNLITLSTMVASGEQNIPYHADDELCQWFSAADVSKILEAATAFKTYHISYFNSLKSYIAQMQDIDAVKEITYGSYIPDEYQSDVLKTLMENIG